MQANVLLDRQGHICLADMGLAAEFSHEMWNAQKADGSFSVPKVAGISDIVEPKPVANATTVDKKKGTEKNSLQREEDFFSAELRMRKTNCGTPMYQAPEMLNSFLTRQAYGPSVDVWSLGVMLFQRDLKSTKLVSITPPFHS